MGAGAGCRCKSKWEQQVTHGWFGGNGICTNWGVEQNDVLRRTTKQSLAYCLFKKIPIATVDFCQPFYTHITILGETNDISCKIKIYLLKNIPHLDKPYYLKRPANNKAVCGDSELHELNNEEFKTPQSLKRKCLYTAHQYY
jgi:hypothetical protein